VKTRYGNASIRGSEKITIAKVWPRYIFEIEFVFYMLCHIFFSSYEAASASACSTIPYLAETYAIERVDIS
jgi:hypothetical protein